MILTAATIVLPFAALEASISPDRMVHIVTVILSLVVIEGLLSVDNALGIAALARQLPQHERRMALRLGFIGAYLFRVLALFLATWIIQHDWIKLTGAVYLVYLMCSELTRERVPGQGPGGTDATARFWSSVGKIGLMDLSLSVDNVLTAVAFSRELWLVCTGVLIGIAALRLLAGICLRLIARYPVLEKTAFLLVGYVGLLLVAELAWHIEIGAVIKFTGIVILIALSLIYEKRPAVRESLQPVLRLTNPVMKAFAWLIDAPLSHGFRAFRRLVRSNSRGEA
jgi:YkoY family integral membrane protein